MKCSHVFKINGVNELSLEKALTNSAILVHLSPICILLVDNTLCTFYSNMEIYALILRCACMFDRNR